MAMTPADMMRSYITLRDKSDALEKELKAAMAEKLKPFFTAMAQIEGVLLAHLNAQKLDSMSIDGATCFKTTRTSAKVKEWSKTLEYILDKEAYELLEARVSKTAALAIEDELAQKALLRQQETGEEPRPEDLVIPGVVVEREVVLQVRRK